MRDRSVRFLWQDRHAARDFGAAVSLHSHTMHSREALGFLPRWVGQVPILSWELERQTRRYQARTGRPPDFTSAYWTSPLSSVEAFEVEQHAIENDLGVQAIVSLTDHDNLDAGCELQSVARQIPISVEWTVPFAETFFHIGVHNLAVETARDVMAALARHTSHPGAALQDLLAALDAEPGLLIVLNHPLWDQAGVGMVRHLAILRRLLAASGGRIHALELNGLRPWTENLMVADLAADSARPLVSGGDRHGREPNAVVNLTKATTFAEFAGDVRSGCSHVLFLPQYREPLNLRILQGLFDVLEHRPDLAAREAWTDRVFYVRGDGTRVPLSSVWNGGGPVAVRWFVGCVALAGNGRTQWTLRRMLRFANARRSWLVPASVSRQPAVTTT